MKRLVITIKLTVLTFFVIAQLPNKPTNLQSPNAASLGLYGEVPVSLFTGIPEISIPIFTASEKYNGFSMGLSYHAGGVRPDQHPGWVGTNWTLMVGGCISRIEKGGCDEIVSDYYIGYHANQNILDDNDLIKNNYINYDTEPDEFSFNFGNYSGKFYFDRNKKLIVKSNKTLKVTLLSGSFTVPDELKKGKPTSWLYTFKGFSITTEDGTEYIFGGDQSKLEFNMEFWDQLNNQWYPTAWHLAQIKYPNGKFINFIYDRGKLINQMYFSMSEGSYKLYEMGINDTWKCSKTYASSMFDKYQGHLISPIYLKSIVAKDFSIELKTSESNEFRINDEFYNLKAQNMIDEIIKAKGHIQNWGIGILPYLGVIPRSPNQGKDINAGLAWEKLDEITIYDNDSNIIKKLNLNYNNIPTERLFLDSITYNDGKVYSFEYNDKDKLPPYLADKNDHWGFYNNKLAQYSKENYFVSREPDVVSMKYGSLKQITYPTGGTTEFEYDANQYSSQTKLNKWEGIVNYLENKTTGGLRIRKIINKPNKGELTTKEYFYTRDYTNLQPNGLSSGILGGQIQYYFENRDAAYTYFVSELQFMYGRYSYSSFSAQSVLPLCTNSMGCHIGYSEVVEKLTDGSYTKYKFSNFDTGNLDEESIANIQTESPYQPISSKEQERGNLLSKEVYASNNNIILKTINRYKKSDSEYINSIKGNSTFVACEGGHYSNYFTEATSYKIYTYAMLLDSTETIYYDVSQAPTLKQVQKHKYNSYNQEIENSTQNSDSIITLTKMFYPNEIKNGKLPTLNFNDHTSLANAAIDANCLNLILASEIYTNNRFTKGIYNDYQLNNKLALLKNVYITNSDNTLKNNYQCNNFDSFGNPLFVSINNTENATYLWSYNGEYHIAEVKNASYTDVKAALGYNDSQMENLSANINPDVNAIRAKLDSYFANKQALITSYTYKPLTGMASAKDPRGVTTRYFYDSFGRLSLTKDQNLNIDKSYKYAYYNTDTSSTNTEIEPLTISISKSDATYINTPTTASATVTGGTGNLGFNWYLKNSSGTIIQNALDISSQFNFTCLSTGAYTLQVDVTDYLSGEVLSTTKPINCVYPPLVVSQIIGGPGYLMTTPPYNAYYYSASVTISGGSPSKYCTWRLFDSYPNGNLINTSTASSTFTGTSASWSLYSAPYSTTQTLVLQVRDNILGQTITVTKIMVKQ